jgi:predicted transcriptional regulator
LAADLPPARREHDQRTVLREQLEDTIARLERLRAERENLSWSQRRQRRRLDELIANHSDHYGRLAAQAQHLHDAHVAQDAWLSDHRADVELFVRVDRERRDRQHITGEVYERLNHLHQPLDLLTESATATPDLDTGLDL